MLKEDYRKKPKNQELQVVNAKKKATKDIADVPIFERHTT